jgi:voltage-gated potassium channel
MSRVSWWERRTEWPLAVTSLLFLSAFAWPILDVGLDGFWREVCRYVDYGAWAVFVLDYAVRVLIAERRLHYVGRHIPDLLVIALPVLRPLRLLRVLMLIRFINRRAAHSLRGRVAIYVSVTACLVVFCASLAELDAERHATHPVIRTFGESVWWAVTTMSTVGYGDYYPVTPEGRIVAIGLMLAGVALLGVVTASIAAWLIEAVREVEAESQAATRADIARLQSEIVALRLELVRERHQSGE